MCFKTYHAKRSQSVSDAMEFPWKGTDLLFLCSMQIFTSVLILIASSRILLHVMWLIKAKKKSRRLKLFINDCFLTCGIEGFSISNLFSMCWHRPIWGEVKLMPWTTRYIYPFLSCMHLKPPPEVIEQLDCYPSWMLLWGHMCLFSWWDSYSTSKNALSVNTTSELMHGSQNTPSSPRKN